METDRAEIVELDKAGNITASYIESRDGGKTRVDTLYPDRTKGYGQRILDVFLPAGYPQSVTEDYIQYQIYDSLQAFSSSIAGMLASRAVLEGVGVGDATASPTSALLLSVLQESMGRIATILFAHKLGTALEPECKMYRLAADIFNDTAIILDCLSPAFPKPIRVIVLGFSSVLRSLCGVAAGSSKASLSAHFAKFGNLGEVNAKDSSQETVISLLGMLVGSVVVSWISTPLMTWSTLMLLISVHLATNHAAVRAVSMRSLNRQRANIVFSHMIEHGKVLRPTEVSVLERIFEQDGILRWCDGRVVGRAKIGVNVVSVLERLGGEQHSKTHSRELRAIKLSELMQLYSQEAYMLWFDVGTSEALIVLKEGCKPTDQIQAWAQALLLAKSTQQPPVGHRRQELKPRTDRYTSDFGLTELRHTLDRTRTMLRENTDGLRALGWDLDIGALETTSGARTVIRSL